MEVAPYATLCLRGASLNVDAANTHAEDLLGARTSWAARSRS